MSTMTECFANGSETLNSMRKRLHFMSFDYALCTLGRNLGIFTAAERRTMICG